MLARIISIGLIFLIALTVAFIGLTAEKGRRKIKEKINNIFRFK